MSLEALRRLSSEAQSGPLVDGHQLVLGISMPASSHTASLGTPQVTAACPPHWRSLQVDVERPFDRTTGVTATARIWSQSISLKRSLCQVQKTLMEKFQHIEKPSAEDRQRDPGVPENGGPLCP